MKRILIFSGCLLLFLWLASTSMSHNRVSDSLHSSSSLLLVSGSSVSKVCFVDNLMSNQLIRSINNQLNVDRSYLLSHPKGRHWLNLSKFYVPQMLGWATWIWLPIKTSQPYRNPQRAFRLNKKQRRRLRRRLSNLLCQESLDSTAKPFSSSLELA